MEIDVAPNVGLARFGVCTDLNSKPAGRKPAAFLREVLGIIHEYNMRSEFAGLERLAEDEWTGRFVTWAFIAAEPTVQAS
ncbi:hypothetical protein CERZMDRAFT_101493 [Cercospora zeae-maydis SCOH1-5]|uniref:Uncharacterized protein n=1 Tax=Cercospora zeae-maydis SCOH1-5 TaxID=717836 RepID=A0A6A6F3U4_9PEZI|nr:hypothetical protein CERZMDRAFT_101493 [Cercospora zeae-maydis SCOH1-5]